MTEIIHEDREWMTENSPETNYRLRQRIADLEYKVRYLEIREDELNLERFDYLDEIHDLNRRIYELETENYELRNRPIAPQPFDSERLPTRRLFGPDQPELTDLTDPHLEGDPREKWVDDDGTVRPVPEAARWKTVEAERRLHGFADCSLPSRPEITI